MPSTSKRLRRSLPTPLRSEEKFLNFSNQAFSQVRAFHSPLCASMTAMGSSYQLTPRN